MKKIAIMALGLQPLSVVHFLSQRRPQEFHVIASEWSLNYTAKEQGYAKPNLAVLEEAAKQAGTGLFIYRCDPFDPESIDEAVDKILKRVKVSDEVDINYSGGTQAMSLVLGSVAILLLSKMPVKVLYSTSLGGGVSIADHTKTLKKLFKRRYRLIPSRRA